MASNFCRITSIPKFLKLGWLGLLLWCASATPAVAHLLTLPVGTATIQSDGHYSLDLTFDVIAYALDQLSANTADAAMNELLDGPPEVLNARLKEAATRFKAEFAVLESGRTGTMETLVFPTLEDLQRYKESAPAVRLPVMLVLSLEGRLPPGARSASFRLPDKLGEVALTVVRPDQPIGVLMVAPGKATTPLPVKLEAVVPAASDAPVIAEPSRWEWAQRYLALGFVHILPRGTDHILFVVGLFLLGDQFRPLLMQVTAFTLAHSITLALSMYGVFSLRPQVVEPSIALSIAFVALENIFTAKLHRWRLLVVFGFGLIHGLGFASVLTSIGLPRNEFVTALVTFNAGVECGQLAVIALAFLAVGWWRKRAWYRQRIVVPASGLIAATGIFWTIQRLNLR